MLRAFGAHRSSRPDGSIDFGRVIIINECPCHIWHLLSPGGVPAPLQFSKQAEWAGLTIFSAGPTNGGFATMFYVVLYKAPDWERADL